MTRSLAPPTDLGGDERNTGKKKEEGRKKEGKCLWLPSSVGIGSQAAKVISAKVKSNYIESVVFIFKYKLFFSVCYLNEPSEDGQELQC